LLITIVVGLGVGTNIGVGGILMVGGGTMIAEGGKIGLIIGGGITGCTMLTG
jgi:hypothetical protein